MRGGWIMSLKGQRYQKLKKFSGLGRRGWLGLGAGVAVGLSTGLAAGPAWGTPQAQTAAQAGVRVVDSAAGIGSPIADQALEDARTAMQKKQWAALDALVPVAQTAPLVGMYAQYWSLRQQVSNPAVPTPEAQLQQFMANYPHSYLADRLRGDWVVAAARAGDFATVNRLGPVASANAAVVCSQLAARYVTGQQGQTPGAASMGKANSAPQAVTAQEALEAFRPVNACWNLLERLAAGHVLGWADMQENLRAILETGKTGNAQRMAGIMFNAAQMRDYTALMKNPRAWLTGRKVPQTQAERELVTLALSRLARSDDRLEAESYIEKNWAAALSKADIQWVWGQFGLVAALNVEPQAVRWYRRSGTAPMTDYNHAWQVRSELRQTPIDWQQVDAAIQRMSALQQSEPVWVYWRGRAIAGLGDPQTAHKFYASLRDDLGFYGLLALEELGEKPMLPPKPSAITQAERDEARANVGLARAVRLFRLGWRPEAVPEWNFALRGMNDRQLRAAAELAREEQIFDRVVNTSLLTRDEVDFSQRFVAPFEGRVSEKARQINLEPAWVYGLIRQESRFIMDARSRVGASGLMQLMPATARWVAKKIGMSNFTPAMVNDFDTNTILGTSYMDMVLDKLDGSQLLATAGYNAGPGRPVQWRSKLGGPVEGAIFAETIPFTETRLYVKHVMSNAVYYALLFTGQPQSLKARLGTVAPQPAKKVALP